MKESEPAVVWPEWVAPDEAASADAWSHHDAKLPWVNQESLSTALQGFELSMPNSVSASWLALAVRRAVACTLPDPADDPATTPSNTEIKKKIRGLADRARDLWVDLRRLDHHSENAVTDFLASQEAEIELWHQTQQGLGVLHNILAGTANTVASDNNAQPTRWRDKARREARIERVQFLVPIFEKAYGETASANDYPSGKAAVPTPFMSFYQRVVALALNERATPDLGAVAKAGISRHRRRPVRLANGLIPGYPYRLGDPE